MKHFIATCASILMSAYVINSQELITSHKSLPRYMTAEELEYVNLNPDKAADFNYEGGVSALAFPDMIVPGEFEESMAVVITWSGAYPKVQTALINAIQKECPVWIIVDTYSDTSAVKSAMSTYGYTLSSYKFFKTSFNDFWARDYGPYGFYYNNLNGYGFIDASYYTPRPLDDAIPGFLAGKLGFPVVKTKLKYEGGNFITDGFGQSFYSSRVPQANSSVYGWSSTQTNDTMETVFNMSKSHQVTQLSCDGGTGHVDIYFKLLDEQTMLLAEYPKTVTANDRQTIEDNVAYLKTLKTTYGKPFTIQRIHTPTDNSGSALNSCDALNYDIRGYVNGLLVNKTFIMPTFHSSTSGNASPDDAAVDVLKKYMPGYKIVPIDARSLTTMGGAIHCITMQIPTDNPVRFWHPRVEGEQQGKAQYDILAEITNKSGIASANCKWRLKGQSSWNNSSLSYNTSSGKFEGAIPNTGFTNKDTVEYYLEATANNGKYMTKPITAPDGFYKFYFGGNVSVNEKSEEMYHVYAAYPQPAENYVRLPFYVSKYSLVNISITDITGKQIYSTNEHIASAGNWDITINTHDFAPGIYLYTIKADGASIGTRKFVVKR